MVLVDNKASCLLHFRNLLYVTKTYSSPESLGITFPDTPRGILASHKWLRAFCEHLLAMFLAKNALWVISAPVVMWMPQKQQARKLLNGLACAMSSWSSCQVITKRTSEIFRTLDADINDWIIDRSFWKCVFHLAHIASSVIFPAQNNVWQFGHFPYTILHSPCAWGRR